MATKKTSTTLPKEPTKAPAKRMSPPRSAAQRKADERDRRKSAGLVKVECWVHPEDRTALREVETQLRIKREDIQRAAAKAAARKSAAASAA